LYRGGLAILGCEGMVMNKEDLLELFKRRTYVRFVTAFDYRKTVPAIVHGLVGDTILERIKQEHADIYNEYAEMFI